MELRKQLDSPAASGAVTARQKAARKRAAESRQQRLEQAIAQLPELKQKQAEAAQRAGQGKCGDQIRAKQPRVSTTDAATRVMKMANGGYSLGSTCSWPPIHKAVPFWGWKSATRVPIRRG